MTTVIRLTTLGPSATSRDKSCKPPISYALCCPKLGFTSSETGLLSLRLPCHSIDHHPTDMTQTTKPHPTSGWALRSMLASSALAFHSSKRPSPKLFHAYSLVLATPAMIGVRKSADPGRPRPTEPAGFPQIQLALIILLVRILVPQQGAEREEPVTVTKRSCCKVLRRRAMWR